MQQTAAALILVLGCGGGHREPTKPHDDTRTDPKTLAREIDEDMVRLGRIARELRGKCEETIAELRPHVILMQKHHEQATGLAVDGPERKQLVVELDLYEKRATGRTDQIAQDLAATYQACGTGCTPDAPCPARYQLERVIADIPTY